MDAIQLSVALFVCAWGETGNEASTCIRNVVHGVSLNSSSVSIPPLPLPHLSLPLSLPSPLELSQERGLTCDDIISTLQYYSLLKYWKGKHIIIRRKVRIM